MIASRLPWLDIMYQGHGTSAKIVFVKFGIGGGNESKAGGEKSPPLKVSIFNVSETGEKPAIFGDNGSKKKKGKVKNQRRRRRVVNACKIPSTRGCTSTKKTREEELAGRSNLSLRRIGP